MERRHKHEWDEDDWDADDVDEDFDADDEDATTECPHCHREIYEDAEQCPHCGEYLTAADRAGKKPLWFIIGAILCLLVAMYWILV